MHNYNINNRCRNCNNLSSGTQCSDDRLEDNRGKLSELFSTVL